MAHFPKAKNDRAHDIVLFAKYHYHIDGTNRVVNSLTALKMLIQYHNGWDLSSLPSDKDVLSVVLTDTLHYLLDNGRAIYELIQSGGDCKSSPFEEDIGYQQKMVLSILSKVAHTLGAKFPFLPLEPDHNLRALLHSKELQAEYGYQR